MDRILYKLKNDCIDIGYNKYIDIDGLKNEKIKEIIVKNCEKINKNEIANELEQYLKNNYDGLDFNIPTEIDNIFYANGWEMLNETDYTFYKLSEILTEFDNGELTIKINEKNKDFYRFVLNNFEIINGISA